MSASSLQEIPRARTQLRAVFKNNGGQTFLARLYESDGLRLRTPRAIGISEAVALNTAGGIVGGDEIFCDYRLEEGARLLATTQSAEKIYRSDGACARIETRLCVGGKAELIYAPQETIFFDGARARRLIRAEVAADARLLIAERFVFGRIAMGEICRNGFLRDEWRVYRAGELIFADNFHLQGDLAEILDRPACGGGARAIATLVLVDARADKFLDRAREALAPFQGANGEAGVSAFDGLLSARLVHRSPFVLNDALAALLACLHDGGAPRLWRQ